MIDYDNVLLIINKLTLYIENEEKNISNIQSILDELDNYYYSDNSKVLKTKKQNIINNLNIILENKKKSIDMLSNTLHNYRALDEENALSYNNYQ